MKQPTKKPAQLGRPRTGKALTPAERMRRMRERRRAAGLKPVVAWIPSEHAYTPFSQHRVLDARSLAMHVAIARKIERAPELLDVPHRNLERWSARSDDSPPPWLLEWHQILRRPWPEVAALITELSENAARLRQSSPFAGVLTPAERRRIYEAFRA